MTSDDVPPTVEALRAQLLASRRALLAALEGVTERDFAAPIEDGGPAVIEALASLAPAERESVRRAAAALGPDARPPALPATETTRGDRPLPPQVMHDLAGARHITTGFLERLDEPSLGRDAGGRPLGALLAAIAERETAAAARLAAARDRLAAARESTPPPPSPSPRPEPRPLEFRQ